DGASRRTSDAAFLARVLRGVAGVDRERFGPGGDRATRAASPLCRRVAQDQGGKARSGKSAPSAPEARLAGGVAEAGGPRLGRGYRTARNQDSRICAEADPRAPLTAPPALP